MDLSGIKAGVFKRFWDFLVSIVSYCGYCGVYNVNDYIVKYKSKFKFTTKDYVEIGKQLFKFHDKFMEFGSKSEIDKIKKKM